MFDLLFVFCSHESMQDSSGFIIDTSRWFVNGEVTANPEGSLQINGQGPLLEVDPGVFRWASSGSVNRFELDTSGPTTHLYQKRTAYERVPWLQTPPAQLGLLALTVLVFLSAAIAWLVSVVRRQASGRWLSGLVGSMNLLFLGGLVAIMAPAATGGDIWQFFFAPSLPLLLVLSIPLGTVVLTVALTVHTVRDCIGGRRGLFTRLHNSLVIVAAVAFLYFLHTWNLLGYRF
jgi:hypothetical protein